jgi:hypothetical protein
MRATFGFIGILIVLAIGYLIYSARIQSGTDDTPLPRQTNLVAVKRDLLSFGQAERLYLATNGRYATLEQLRNSHIVNNLPGNTSWGYEFSVEVNGAEDFCITARPMDSTLDLPTFSIDNTMQITP